MCKQTARELMNADASPCAPEQWRAAIMNPNYGTGAARSGKARIRTICFDDMEGPGTTRGEAKC